MGEGEKVPVDEGFHLGGNIVKIDRAGQDNGVRLVEFFNDGGGVIFHFTDGEGAAFIVRLARADVAFPEDDFFRLDALFSQLFQSEAGEKAGITVNVGAAHNRDDFHLPPPA
jgi:hypothetical protein